MKSSFGKEGAKSQPRAAEGATHVPLPFLCSLLADESCFFTVSPHSSLCPLCAAWQGRGREGNGYKLPLRSGSGASLSLLLSSDYGSSRSEVHLLEVVVKVQF